MDAPLWTALVLGFVLGIKHATDADHVVAVSTIVSQSGSVMRASWLGIFWGLGHTATLFVVGIAVIGFKVTIPDRLALFMEFAVGIMLVVLGWVVLRDYTPALWRRLWSFLHSHEHGHEVGGHSHLHHHESEKELKEAHGHQHGARTPGRAVIIGMVHGLAGSAALMLLVLTTIPTPLLGLLYILVFGVGSVGGMLLISSAISLPFVFTATRFSQINQGVRIAAGTISVLLGFFVMYQIGFVEGLIYQV